MRIQRCGKEVPTLYSTQCLAFRSDRRGGGGGGAGARRIELDRNRRDGGDRERRDRRDSDRDRRDSDKRDDGRERPSQPRKIEEQKPPVSGALKSLVTI